MFKKLSLLFLLFYINNLIGQFSNIPGLPFIKNFSKTETKNELKIFEFSQSENGEIYFATPSGLLKHDGVHWDNYSLGFESDLRSVYYKNENRIYTSGHGGFGYWSKNLIGGLNYTSLFYKKPNEQDPLLPVFLKIKEINGKILFQTFQQIFMYDPVTNSLDSVGAFKGFEVLFETNGRAFIKDVGIGLFEILGKERKLLEGTSEVQFELVNVFEINKNELLLITKDNGIWEWKNNKVSKKKWNVNIELEKHLISDVRKFEKDKYIIGTVRNGVYIIESSGEIIFHIDKSYGLPNNAVLKVFSDLNSNIWVSFNNELSFIQVNSNTKYLFDTKGVFGTVYTSFLDGTLLYLGTNQGLFVKDLSIRNSDPKLIPGSHEQIWNIDTINGQILVAHQRGVSIITNNNLKTIDTENGAWIFKKHPKIENLLYVGYYGGIGIYNFVNEKWVFKKKLNDFGESSRFMEFDQFGQLWIAHPQKGYYKIILSDNGEESKEVKFYNEKYSNVAPYAYFCKIDGNLFFYNPLGFFSYDPIDNKFIKAKYPSEIFKGIKNINSITQYDDVFWYSSKESLGYILREGNKFKRIEEPFNLLKRNHLNDFNKFTKISNSVYGIGILDGMFFHEIKGATAVGKLEKPLIQSIQLISKTDSIFASLNSEKLEIPFKNNFVKFSIATPKAPIGNLWEISYRLKGLETKWSKWSIIREISFPGLSPGSYTLELQVKDGNENISEIKSQSFYVKNPWYFNTISITIYVLIFILINLILRYYYLRKNKKQIALVLKQEKENRILQQEKHELENLKAEKKVLLLEDEKLKLEIEKKNFELATSTLNNIQKNELISDLKKDIEELKNSTENAHLNTQIKKLAKKTNNLLVNNDDWLTFELHFMNAHENFFNNLKEKHQNLSSNEYKLCAYLKLNLSSKEIASLMNISSRSVEQNRYRLRQKLDLDKDSNLNMYIQSF